MSSNITWERHDVDGVWIGEAPGYNASQPTIAISGGVHGNEETGVKYIDDLVSGKAGLNLDAGRIIAIHGNLEAMAMNDGKGARATEEGLNLNRSFKPLDPMYAAMDEKDRPYEINRGQELMSKVLNNLNQAPEDRPKGLLDIHDFTFPGDPIFMIADPYFGPEGHDGENDGYAIARAIGSPIISSGWKDADPGGSDGFMTSIGNLGICIETGYRESSGSNMEFARGAAARLVIAFGMFEGKLPPLFSENGQKPRFIWNEGPRVRKTDLPYKLVLPEQYRQTFTRLPRGMAVAHMDGKLHRAPLVKPKLIIFPEPDVPKNTEAFYFGHEFDPKNS